ncbi:MAG: tryptophan halogenase family protein [Sandaracinobacteroides sp.]
MDRRISDIVVVGGGSAGWMAAAALANGLGLGRGGEARITLVESEEIGIVGVGEATIPPIRQFNQQLGLDEAAFVAATQGSFKLGIEFANWGWKGNRYFHPFGTHGTDFDAVSVHHWWARARADGDMVPLDDFSMAWALARHGRFLRPTRDPRLVQSTHDYAYHFDAVLYGHFLRKYAQNLGVVRTEGRVVSATRNATLGHIAELVLADGRQVAGDLFIDCSGFRGLLIEEILEAGFEDWSNWLPCDRAIAVPTENSADFTPFTRSTAHEAGWQWRIPLQHRTGNGHVFSSAFMSEDEARDILLNHVDGRLLAEPRLLRFTAGRRREAWKGNVVAIGLSAGFLEPLESTSLHLIQSGITRLLALFPDRDFAPHVRNEYNRVTRTEWERVRDFLILHYHLNSRTDGELWRHCASYAVPDNLANRIAQFRSHGRMVSDGYELFQNPSWLAVHVGQGNLAERPDPLADHRSFVPYAARLGQLRAAIAQVVAEAPSHAAFIAGFCPAAPELFPA